MSAPASGLVANFTWSPTNPIIDQTVYFDASSSTSATSSIASFLYSWGDGSFPTGNIFGSSIQSTGHQFQLNGTFTVTLNVTDRNGNTASVSKQITVSMINGDTPPAALFTYNPARPIANSSVTFDASASRDPDGDTIAKYNWTIGLTGPSGFIPGTLYNYTTVSFSHIFPKTGSYQVILIVTDNHQHSSSQNNFFAVTRTPYLPGVSQGVYAKYYFSTNTSSAGQFLGYAVNVTHVSGTKVTTLLSVIGPNGTTFGFSNQTIDVYTGEGIGNFLLTVIAANLRQGDALYAYFGPYLVINYTITQSLAGASRQVNVFSLASPQGITSFEFDQLTGLLVGLDSESNGQKTKIALGDTNAWSPTGNEAPLPLFTWTPGNPNPGQTVAFDGTHSYDPDHDSGLVYKWNFGDGATSNSVSSSHTYAQPGNYTVSLEVNDTSIGITASKLIQVGHFSPTSISILDDGVCAGASDTACKFTPSTLTVNAGTIVSWTNYGTVAHAPTSCSTSNNPGTFACPTMNDVSLPSFASGPLTNSQSYSYNFTTPGTYYYYDSIHQWIHGIVTVVGQTLQPGISLVPYSPTLTIMQGDIGSTAIVVGSLNGFSGYVTLSVNTNLSPQPSFNPSTVYVSTNNYAQPIMIVNVTLGTPVGVYNMTVVGTCTSQPCKATTNILVIVTPSQLVAKIPAGKYPNGVAYDSGNGFLYVSDAITNLATSTPGNVTVINATTGKIVATIPVQVLPGGIGYDSGNGYVYVSNYGSGTVSVINGTTIIANIGLPTSAGFSAPTGVAYDTGNKLIYVSNWGRSVSVLNGTTLVATIPVGTAAFGLAYDSGNGYIYVANPNANTTTVIDGKTNTVVTTVPVGHNPTDVAYDSANGYLYVTNRADSSVTIISGTSVISTVQVKGEANSIAYDDGNGNIYLTNVEGNVTIISGTSVVATDTVGCCLNAITYDNSNQYIYVTNYATNTVDQLNATVVPSGTFSISAISNLLTAPVGSQTSTTITVTGENGFVGTVSLTNSTSTTALKCSLSQTSVTLSSSVPSGTSRLTCTGSAAGTYQTTITGNGNNAQHSATVTVFVPRIAYIPAITVGQSATFRFADVTWSSNVPPQILQEPNPLPLFNETDHVNLVVTKVSGTKITFDVNWYFKNGTSITDTTVLDVATGQFNQTDNRLNIGTGIFLLAGSLQSPDHIYETPSSPIFNMTSTRTLLGVARTVNFLNSTQTNPVLVHSLGFAWDQASGVFAGATVTWSYNIPSQGTAYGRADFVLTATNIWTSGTAKPSVTITSLSQNPVDIGNPVSVYFTVASPTAVSGISVNWGDGTTTDSLPGTATSDLNHVYTKTGTFTVNVTATNSAGSASATISETVNLRPATLTVSCSPGTVLDGASTNCKATATGPGGNPSGQVTFSTNSTTGTFTPADTCTLIMGTCSATYSDTATSNRTATISVSYPGDTYYTSATGSFSLSVTVSPPAFDFTLSIPSPASVFVVQGETSPTSSITATLTSGSTSSLTFSATGLPSGVTATFTNNPCSPTCTVTVSFSATATTTPGTSPLTITAVGGGASHSAYLSLTVIAPFTYATIDYPGATGTDASGVNNAGEIIGSYTSTSSLCVTYASGAVVCRSGYALSAGSFATFYGPPNNSTTIFYVHAINSTGYVVGAHVSNGQFYGIATGFIVYQGSYTVINDPNSCGGATDANGINDAGQIVGEYETCGGATYGYLLSSATGSYTTIEYPGARVTLPQGINNAGTIVGAYLDQSNHVHGFTYDSGTYASIDYPGASETRLQAINSLGQTVGYWVDSTGKAHGFLRNADGTYINIDIPGATSTVAEGINDYGQIVGAYTDSSGTGHGFTRTIASSASLSCFATPIINGASSTCTVTVKGFSPGGSVSFTQTGPGAVAFSSTSCSLASGSCSVTLTGATTGPVTIQANYAGDLANIGSKASTSISVVNQSSLTLSCSPSSVNVGRFTTCTATVTGSSPSGTVSLTSTSPTGSFTPLIGNCNLSAGSCSVTYADTSTSSTTATISASYAGDAYNSRSQATFSLTITKPVGVIAVGTSSTTIDNGGASVTQTATGISVTITGSSSSNGAPVGVTTQTLSTLYSGVTAPSLTSPTYYDVQVTGITTGTAQICINFNSASSATTMQYWNGTAWTTATSVTVSGTTVCGQIPVSALTGTNIALGNTIQLAPSQPANSNQLLIIIAVVAVVAILAVVAVLSRRRGRSQLEQRRASR